MNSETHTCEPRHVLYIADEDFICGECGKPVDLRTPEGRALIRGKIALDTAEALEQELPRARLSNHDGWEPEYWLETYPILVDTVAEHGQESDERDPKYVPSHDEREYSAMLLAEICEASSDYDDEDVLAQYLADHVAVG